MGELIDFRAIMATAKTRTATATAEKLALDEKRPRVELPPHAQTEGLPERLVRAMNEAGLDGKSLGEKSGVDAGYISLLMRGKSKKPSIAHIAYLADALNVPSGWLAFGEGDVVPKRSK